MGLRIFTDIELLDELRDRLETLRSPEEETAKQTDLFKVTNLEGEDVTGKTPYQVALSYLGLAEQKGKPKSNEIIEKMYDDVLGYRTNLKDDTAWCAAFGNHTLKLAGYKYVKTLGARDSFNQAEKWGTVIRGLQNATRGDVAILALNGHSWRGHWMYMDKIGIDGDNIVVTGPGGNQSDQVKVSTYTLGPSQRYRLYGIVRPEKA